MTQAQPNACEHCGAPLAGNTTFCGSCGKPVTAPKPAEGGGLKKTMFGMPQEGLAIPIPRNSVAPAPVANVPPKPDADPTEAERGHDRSTQEGVVVPPRGQMGRTMLGVPMV